jgi:hypothetical protein
MKLLTINQWMKKYGDINSNNIVIYWYKINSNSKCEYTRFYKKIVFYKNLVSYKSRDFKKNNLLSFCSKVLQ